eukprot:m.207382 g.207382  ORF g.207382 m.207382 type:complete len:81 (-) comp32985_c0_seq1:2517-2759(-)
MKQLLFIFFPACGSHVFSLSLMFKLRLLRHCPVLGVVEHEQPPHNKTTKQQNTKTTKSQNNETGKKQNNKTTNNHKTTKQ